MTSRPLRAIQATLALAVFLLVTHTAPSHAAWEIQKLISGEKAGEYNSLDLDGNDEIGVSFYDADDGVLRYLYQDNSTMQIVDNSTNNIGLYTSLEFDDSDCPHISYLDDTNGELRYALGDAAYPDIWDPKTTLDKQLREGEFSSLVLDGDGIPHISYREEGQNAPSNLKYITKDSGNWTNGTRVADPPSIAVANGTSIAVNGNDLPRIAYRGTNSTSLNFASYNGTNATWSKEVVDANGTTGAFPSLAMGGDDTAFISYRDEDSGLKLIQQSSGGWVREDVETGNLGTYTSLALDSDGNPHISYFGVNGTDLKYAYHNDAIGGDGWNITVVDNATTQGHTTSLRLDSNDMPHISYYDGGSDALNYATNPTFYSDVGVSEPSETSDTTSDDNNGGGGGGGGCLMSPEASFGAGWLLLLLVPLMALRLRRSRA